MDGGRAREAGQGTVEWVGLLACLALLFLALVLAGVRVPGAALAEAVASRLLCAAAIASDCDSEPALIAAYGSELGALARLHAPTILFERGSRALPVDFRRCRARACSDGSARGLVRRTDSGLPVTVFVRVVDCRAGEGEGAGCDGSADGNVYIQYWLYYPDSATMRGVPVLGRAGYHRDDWESVQVRIDADGEVAQRASSHHGYNDGRGVANWASEAGITAVNNLAESVGARPERGWGEATGVLFVSGGSHAGANRAFPRIDRIALARDLRLVPLEPIAAQDASAFAVSPPWRKRVWLAPEYPGTE